MLRIHPAAGDDPRSIGMLGPHDVVATLLVVTALIDPATAVGLLRTALEGCPDVRAGVSELPNGCGVSVRLLGPTSAAVHTAVRTAWCAARVALLGAPAPDLRKG